MSKIPDIAIEATSSIAGAGAAYQAGDPSAGYAVSEFLNNGLRGLLEHFSSQRQSKRITDVTEFALNEIRRRLEDGERLRDDGFFDKTIDRSDAEEVFEAVLLKVRDEPEEKKIPYMGSLFANACFDHGLDSGLLHFLCKDFESLTYRQICIIKVIIENKYPLSFKSVVERTFPEDPIPQLSVETSIECVHLRHRGYVDFEQSPPDDPRSGAVALLVPGTMRYTVPAVQMYGRMGLSSIPESDVHPIGKALS